MMIDGKPAGTFKLDQDGDGFRTAVLDGIRIPDGRHCITLLSQEIYWPQIKELEFSEK